MTAQAASIPTHPQLVRVARLLGVEVEQLPVELATVPADDLRTLHDQIGEAIHRGARARFAAVAGLAAKLPAPVAGRLAQTFLPPMLAARVCEHLEPARARDLVDRVSLPYLADIAVALDPVGSREVVRAIPAPRVGEVAHLLLERREYVVMAEFARVVDEDALVAALEAASPHDLLCVVPLLEWNETLERVVAHLPSEQLDRIVAELDHEELADLALALDPVRFGPVIARVDEMTVTALTGVLLDREEHAAMARLATVLPIELLSATLHVVPPDELDRLRPLLTDEQRELLAGLS